MLVIDSFFLYNKNSIIVPKFVTEINENITLHGEISDTDGKIDDSEGLNLIKLKPKNPFKVKKDVREKSSTFSLTKINRSAPGIANNKIYDFSILLSK